MTRSSLALLVMLCGCGRIDFDRHTDAATLDAAPRFCAGHPTATFCEDFDDPNGLAAWDAAFPAANITYEPIASSAPIAARVILGPGTMTCRYARFNKKFTRTTTHVHWEFAFWLGEPGADPGFGNATIAQLIGRDLSGAHVCGVFLQARTASPASINEQDFDLTDTELPNNTQPIPTTLVPGRFTNAAFDLDFGASPRYTFTLDGVPQLVDVPLRPECTGTASAFDANPGFHCLGMTTVTYEVRLDNIVVDATP